MQCGWGTEGSRHKAEGSEQNTEREAVSRKEEVGGSERKYDANDGRRDVNAREQEAESSG
jgi:hypothetical protein